MVQENDLTRYISVVITKFVSSKMSRTDDKIVIAAAIIATVLLTAMVGVAIGVFFECHLRCHLRRSIQVNSLVRGIVNSLGIHETDEAYTDYQRNIEKYFIEHFHAGLAESEEGVDVITESFEG